MRVWLKVNVLQAARRFLLSNPFCFYWFENKTRIRLFDFRNNRII